METTTQRLKAHRLDHDHHHLSVLLQGVVKRNHLGIDDIVISRCHGESRLTHNKRKSRGSLTEADEKKEFEAIRTFTDEVKESIRYMSEVSSNHPERVLLWWSWAGGGGLFLDAARSFPAPGKER